MSPDPVAGIPSALAASDDRAFLIAGAGGMLGTALQRILTARGVRFEAPGEREFDITDPVAVKRRVAAFRDALPAGCTGVLLNAAAYTNVEAAEEHEDLAYLVNAQGPAILARAARAAGLGLVHVSTDFVYDGRKVGPYSETDDTNPLSVYGTSKLVGEVAVAQEYPDAIIARTAWVFGPAGVNFPTKILELAATRGTLSVVTDEIGSPTYTLDLAAGLLGLVDAGASGLYHLAGEGACSRLELARAVLDGSGLSTVQLEPVTSEAFPTRAARPHNSVLDCTKAAALGVTMPQWQNALARFLAQRV